MHWDCIFPFLIAWQYTSYLRKSACFHCRFFTDKLLYRLQWNNLAIIFFKPHKEKKNALFPAHLCFQPFPLARKNSPSHLLQNERSKIYFRWRKRLEQSIKRNQREKLGPPEKMKDHKGHTRKKRGKLVSYSCCQEEQSCPTNHTSAVLQWVFQSPPWEDLEDLEEDFVFLWAEGQNPSPVKSNHYQERENITGNGPDLPEKVVHSGNIWGVSRDLKRTDSTKPGSWNSENKRTKQEWTKLKLLTKFLSETVGHGFK